jgi:hypothetical protein
MVRPPQNDAPTQTDGDNSATRGAGILGGPIFFAIIGVVVCLIIAVMVAMVAK